MRWRPGLRASITLTVVLMTAAATIAMAVAAYELQAGPIRDQFTASAQAGFDSDAQQANKNDKRGLGTEASKVDRVADFMRGRLGLAWAVVNLRATSGPLSPAVDGKYLPVASSPGAPRDLPVDQLDRARNRRIAYTVDSASSYVLAGPLSPGLVLVEFYSTAKVDRELSLLRIELALIATVVCLLAALAGAVAARRIQRRVRLAADAARRFGDGELGVRVVVHGRDELADLAGSFNAMAQRLGESIERLRTKDRQQRRFIADVAHDLRTPLASMTAAADSLHSPSAGDRARSAELLGTQVRRLSTLVEDLLEMSRFDAGAAELRPETVDLQALAADAIEPYGTDPAGPDDEIPVQVLGDPVVLADPRRLHTIVRNLISNAVRHGAPPVTVTIDGRSPVAVSIAVADHGPGLSTELAPFVFDRFVRGDRARRQTEGSGLGLAIAYENALLHGGQLHLAGNNAGATFVLTVPRGQPEDSVRDA